MKSYHSKLFLTLSLLFYYIFLYISKNTYFSLFILPLLFLFFDFNIKTKLWLIALLSLFDFPLLLSFTSPYEISNLYPIVKEKFSISQLILIIPLINLLVFGFTIVLSFFLITLRRKIFLPNVVFFSCTIILLILGHHLVSHIDSTTSHLAIIFLSVLSKKLWLIFLMAYSFQLLAVSKLELTTSFFMHTNFFREQYNISFYHDKKNDHSVKLLTFSIIGIFLFTISYLLSNSTMFFNSCTLDTFNLKSNFCFMINRLSKDFLRSILAEPLIFYLVPLSLGFDMSRPWRNFWTFTNWNNLLSKLFYFYSLLVSTIFIQDFYKFFQSMNVKNKQLKVFLSVLGGVLFGGICFHLLKDFIFNEKTNSKLILFQIFNFRFFIYFLLLALSCATVEITNGRLNKKANWLIAICLFIFFIILRSYFAGYFIKN